MKAKVKKPVKPAYPENRVRSSAVMLWMHPEEKAAFTAAAKADRRSLSDWIRLKLGEVTGFVLPEKS